ncbi:hypothetical protein BpHYR1_046412 [Brachionus plicatilis]|uniref:Uncharacterized protein n=1 Tax=Brachionus plicatilis TaxID=10195 RepID=A0A3M7RHP8_BRAPC|nr:hypothetical protein BpHYR1_046412 [Brachionus plicatilis]
MSLKVVPIDLLGTTIIDRNYHRGGFVNSFVKGVEGQEELVFEEICNHLLKGSICVLMCLGWVSKFVQNSIGHGRN